MNWQEKYKDRIVSTDEAVVRSLQPGARVVFGHAAAAPQHFAEAMFRNRESLRDITVFHMLYFGKAWHLMPEMEGHVRGFLNFLEGNSRSAYRDRRVDFVPCHFHEVPELFSQGFYPVDVAVVQVSEPDAEGRCSFGVSADYTKPAAMAAKVVVAEINPQMPYIGGDNLISLEEIDYMIPIDQPVVEVINPPVGEIEKQIGKHCAELIQDGATLQLGIGGIPDAVLSSLDGKKDIGIHTEMFTDGVMHAIRSGLINGKAKTLHPGKVVTSIIMGSEELYRFVDHNDMIECYPVNYVNNPYVIAKNDRLVSINSCIEMDLTGQAASESIGYEQFSGTGGQVDFLRGARYSKGGISIMAFPSTAKAGEQSRIVPILKEGATVTSGRMEIDYVATEYGAVRLRGRSLRERAELLISIAHPKFRPWLEEEYRKRFCKSVNK
ncbi:4-hydroxybutyrate CoA-transferase [Porphyromonas crevioricanis]|uniref:acetyl-CoA hydrolase/transferase family protein n=1 Tax=Porphyromonas crevioricanis TaxID=393921 RepID=UPI00052C0AAC|nr:acetyl-CoA hydrolase/transferase C-terminal domain-containing protein [Porphyromonas crevioricanis]KGN89210.1 4-hydroxybutyrate CoA-transferase [Porphyromonas crevioricanis]